MEPDELQLAIAYADLANSLAYRDFIAMQAIESERLELMALNSPATDFEVCRSAIIAWQQHRRIMRSLQELVHDAVKSQQVENNDARSDPARADRSNW